jgi:serine/threonine-protein kinase
MTTYRVERELGRGGMAVVYAGHHEDLGRPVALKVLADHLAGDAEFRNRFLREARIAARLQHPGLVRVYDITALDGLPTIVMELLPGGTLEGGRLSLAEAAQVADGLAYAHAQGVVHRDLKPANLLRAEDGSVKLADFGIARAAEETMVTQAGTVLGTLRYLAPEQAAGQTVGPAADVYSLAVVLDELLEERPRALAALLDRCRASDPRERPAAADVARALRGDTVQPPTRVLPAPRRRVPRLRLLRRPRALPALLALGAVAAAAAAAGLAASSGGSSSAPRVEPVPRSPDPARQARDLAAWLQRHSR